MMCCHTLPLPLPEQGSNTGVGKHQLTTVCEFHDRPPKRRSVWLCGFKKVYQTKFCSWISQVFK